MLNPADGRDANGRSGGGRRGRSVESAATPDRAAALRGHATSPVSHQTADDARNAAPDGEQRYWLVPVDRDARQ